MKKVIWTVIIVAIIVLIGTSIYKSKDSGEETIKIGGILSLSGPAAAFGELALKGMNLAAEEINAKGGIDGKRVELIIEDDRTDAKTAVAAFQKLTSIDKVNAIVGGLWDFTAQPLFPLALESQTALISPSNFRIENGFEMNDQSFVSLPDFEKVIRALKVYIEKNNIQKMAIVRFQSRFGQEIADTLRSIMSELGRAPLVEETYAQIGNNDFRTIIAKLKQEKPDAVFLDMVGPDPLSFLKRAKELSLKSQIFAYTGGAPEDLANPDVDKSLFENMVVLDWEISSAEFNKLFSNKYGIKPTKSADKAYDAVHILAQAISKIDDKTKLAEYIEKNQFETLNGIVKFTNTHTVESIPVEIKIVKKGVLMPYNQ